MLQPTGHQRKKNRGRRRNARRHHLGFESLEARQVMATILGTGAAALIGGDLTDPDNNGDPEANTNYNAIFRGNAEAAFAGGEFAFNVFDNRVGGGNDKWCCGEPSTINATDQAPLNSASTSAILGSWPGVFRP